MIHVVLLVKPMCEQKLVMKLIVSFNNILIYCNILYFINIYLSNRSEFIFCCHEHAWYTVYFPHSHHHHHYYYIPFIFFLWRIKHLGCCNFWSFSRNFPSQHPNLEDRHFLWEFSLLSDSQALIISWFLT